MDKIFPLNLTARAATLVVGNPVTTRLEGGVGNCYPGLEYDHRNLDRRFFPGLVFDFGSFNGAPLVSVDTNDPDLDPATFEGLPADAPPAAIQNTLRADLNGDKGKALRQGSSWALDSITQEGKTITVRDTDGMTAWRLVRSLEPRLVDVTLTRPSGTPRRITLSGWRRRFVSTKTGVISEAYKAGELTQSLCSPWMHDFRDCACTYWASNHPDVVLAESVGADPEPEVDTRPIDWLRSRRDPERTETAKPTETGNRRAEMDHYEINERWQELAIVLAGHEISSVFNPRDVQTAIPFDTTDELAQKLVDLAKLEHAVMLEYLYAMYSVKDAAQVTGKNFKDAVTFARHEILAIAVSEMRHLRWANQLIWELEHAGLTSRKFGPSLGVADQIPGVNGLRARELRVLDKQTLADFLAVEKPSGTLDGAYAQVLATLRQPNKYPAPLEQLAERILADGMQHFTRFREIQKVLKPFATGNPPAYLQNLDKATAAQGKNATDLYKSILADLESAYESGDMEDAGLIASARTTMFALKDAADTLAKNGRGVPYF